MLLDFLVMIREGVSYFRLVRYVFHVSIMSFTNPSFPPDLFWRAWHSNLSAARVPLRRRHSIGSSAGRVTYTRRRSQFLCLSLHSYATTRSVIFYPFKPRGRQLVPVFRALYTSCSGTTGESLPSGMTCAPGGQFAIERGITEHILHSNLVVLYGKYH